MGLPHVTPRRSGRARTLTLLLVGLAASLAGLWWALRAQGDASVVAQVETAVPAPEAPRAAELAGLDEPAAERVVARHAPIAKAREISLEHAVPPEPLAASGDVTLLEQAVSNLIHNAVRYIEPGGHVAVVLARVGARFSLRVLDDGPGIPPELRARVFERAFRADSARTRHPGGLGLGLSIALDVASRHGFELDLRTAEAGGAEFELRGDACE